MRSYALLRRLLLGVAAGAVALAPVFLMGDDRIKGVREFSSHDPTVDIFSGIETGALDVKLIPKDSTECRLLIKNKTDKPLNVSLPDVFAGTPVLAQRRPGLFDDFGGGNNSGSAAQQLGIGNPFGNNFQGNFQGGGNQFLNMPPWGNNRGPGMGRGLGPGLGPFNVAPEKVAQLKLQSVCLDPGKPNPRPQMAYQIKPIDGATDKPEVHMVCRMLGYGRLSQRAAQAAAWHLNNGMSWKQLAAMRHRSAIAGISKPVFTRRQLAEGKKAAERAVELAKKPKQTGEVASLSSR
jgi:hypothetical protein